MTRRTTLVVALMAALVLAGCGTDGGGDSSQEPSPGEGTPGTPAGQANSPAGTDAAEPTGPITVYSGRNEELIGPLLESFTTDTGIEAEVRYGDTAELAATILEEGDNSPADVYVGQDAGALGALRSAGRLAELPDETLETVEPRFRAQDGTWVGLSGRARVLVYNTEAMSAGDLPASVMDLTGEPWRGRVGWAPTNGSFQAFVTGMRVELGDETTTRWVEGMLANAVQRYDNNSAIVEATARGEVDVGLVNHYYLYRFLAETPEFEADNGFLDGGDVGSLVNVAGAGVLTSSDHADAAAELIDYLLTDESQRYFATETYEYPLARGVPADDRLPPLESIETPEVDLSDLEDLQGTLELLRRAGALT